MSYSESNNAGLGYAAQEKRLICKPNILVVDYVANRRRTLAQLIDKECGEGTSIEAESIEQALMKIKKNKVSFALIGLNPQEHNPYFIAEEIKLSNPAISVLAVETDVLSKKNDEDILNFINTAVFERITAGVRYVKSLTNCGLKGFTIVVKE